MKTTRCSLPVPIGRTAQVAYDLEAMRGECSRVAQNLMANHPFSEQDLEECARLDEAIYLAQRILKSTVRQIMLSRLSRHTRAH